jgi:hypothetical protein
VSGDNPNVIPRKEDGSFFAIALEATQLLVQTAVEAILDTLNAIKDVDGIKKITDPLPSGTNTLGKMDQGAGGASAWKTDGSAVTQPISAASLPLPTGAALESTLALIKAKTDNLDVPLSTRAAQAEDLQYQYDLEDSVAGELYVGAAPMGELTSAATWTIQRTLLNIDGNPVETKTSSTTAVWDNRLTENYT